MPKNIGLYNNNLSVPRKQDIDNVASQIPTQIEAHNTSSDPHANMNWVTKEEAPKTVVRFVVGTSTAGWTDNDCDYLCDGIDDQVEINAAIQALPNNGGEIKILDGTYNLNSRINIDKNNVVIRGCGASTILNKIWKENSSNPDFETIGAIGVSNVSNIIIDSLCVEGPLYSFDDGIMDTNIIVMSSNNITLSNLLSNKNSVGIIELVNTQLVVKNCKIIDACKAGIFCRGSSELIIDSNNIIPPLKVTGLYGIIVEQGGEFGNVLIINNMISYYDVGINIGTTENAKVYSNNCTKCSMGIVLGRSRNINLCQNSCYDNNMMDIYLSEYSEFVIVSENICYKTSGVYNEEQYTINMDTNCKNCLITNNIIYGKNVYYIAPRSTDYSNNFVYGNKYSNTASLDVLITPSGTQGQVLGYISDNVVGAVNLPQGKITISATVTNSDWTSSGSYVYQQITCEGMTANSLPFVVPQYNVLNDSQQNDWNQIVYIESFEGYCRIYAKTSFVNNINVMITY